MTATDFPAAIRKQGLFMHAGVAGSLQAAKTKCSLIGFDLTGRRYSPGNLVFKH
jgi:hypothetical protein